VASANHRLLPGDIMANNPSHPLFEALRPLAPELIAFRRELHQQPELSQQEFRTSDRVAELLTGWGIAVTRGIGGAGLVGTLRAGNSARSIGLRADMDALPIQEETGKPYASRHAGVMHACGHDGHTAMLLLAARYLAQTRQFDGTVQFIFQPDEEKDAGAARMIADGLFERFPVDGVYAMHNQPDMEQGALAVRAGPVMAGTVRFDIDIVGVGTHAARPHKGVDPIMVASHVVLALQTIVSRNLDPLESAVVTVGTLQAGTVHNVVPQRATLSGTMRYFTPEVRDLLEQRLPLLVEQTAAAHGARAIVKLERGYISTINHEREAGYCREVARNLVGDDKLILDKPPSMGAEDFAYMLQAVPGCYVYIGNGPGEGGCLLHNPHYDFNDDNVVAGAAFWVALAEQRLDVRTAEA